MISGINNKTCEKKKCSLENRFVTAKGEEIEEGWSSNGRKFTYSRIFSQ